MITFLVYEATMFLCLYHVMIYSDQRIKDRWNQFIYVHVYSPYRSFWSSLFRPIFSLRNYYVTILPKSSATTSTHSFTNTTTNSSSSIIPIIFTCDICQLSLGGYDYDNIYHLQQCDCNNNTNPDDEGNRIKCCSYCVYSDLKYQILEQGCGTNILCIQRKCRLDDRFVRYRLKNCTKLITNRIESNRIIRKLDDNQIQEAVRNTATPQKRRSNTRLSGGGSLLSSILFSSSKTRSVTTDNTNNNNNNQNEVFWHCPSPDCCFAAFVEKAPIEKDGNDSQYEAIRRMFISIIQSASYNHHDLRKVKCPVCQITSCQNCHQVWTMGLIIDHTNQRCTKHQQNIEHYNQHQNLSDNNNDIQKWIETKKRGGKNKVDVQSCPSCKNYIEKNEGCIHMTCRCKYQFCWICREQWSSGHSYLCQGSAKNITNTSGNNWIQTLFG